MIISASRRTDIPAYFSEWFINRIKEKYCLVANPFNKNQISFVDLTLEKVDVIVFWTRNAQPLIQYLDFLDEKGYQYYFQFTINNYPRLYEKYTLPINKIINTFIYLSKRVGMGKVIWRYDPIVFTDDLNQKFHLKNFEYLAAQIGRYTKRVVISIVDNYFKTYRRMTKIGTNYDTEQINKPFLNDFLFTLVKIANQFDMKVESCAESKDFSELGIEHGKCIDDELIRDEFGINIKFKKDKTQRIACGCTESKDIGANDTCLMGCEYCYATTSHQLAVRNMIKHNPNYPSLTESVIPKTIDKLIEEFKSKEKMKEDQLIINF